MPVGHTAAWMRARSYVAGPTLAMMAEPAGSTSALGVGSTRRRSGREGGRDSSLGGSGRGSYPDNRAGPQRSGYANTRSGDNTNYR